MGQSSGLFNVQLSDGQSATITQQQIDFLNANNRPVRVLGPATSNFSPTAGLSGGGSFSQTAGIGGLQPVDRDFTTRHALADPTRNTGGFSPDKLRGLLLNPDGTKRTGISPFGATPDFTTRQSSFTQTAGLGGSIGPSGLLTTPRLENLIQGNPQSPARPVLPFAGLRALSPQQMRNSSPEELEMFNEIGRLAGIPTGTFQRELRSSTPRGGSPGPITTGGSRVRRSFV